ncbi:Ig-like domain-containing protein [Solirubrobacter taibaiensis]|nr:Ig-like domain-containing protein [Solirubrobacter taibaiensis]
MSRTIAVLAALVLALLVAATAEAATYDVQLCADPAATGFVARNDNAAAFLASARCPNVPGEPFSGVYVGTNTANGGMTRGTVASWTLNAPAGTTFDAVVVRRQLMRSDPDYAVEAVKADGTIVDACLGDNDCDGAATNQTFRRTRGLTFQVRCVAATCATSQAGPRASYRIVSGTATIDDPAPPVIVAATASAWQRTPALTVSATDASGVASLTVKTGEKALGTTTLTCDFRHLQPCPGTGSATFTTDLPDGTYPLTVTATDAAGQASTAPYGTLMLDRTAPASPIGLTVRATGNGMYAYSWTNPDQGQAAPIAAAHLSDGTVVRGADIQQLESASPVERVHLEDAAGNADPTTAAGTSSNTPLQLKPPILQSTTAPKIKIASAKRQGTRLVVKGTVSNATTSKVTVTLTRGKRTARKTATLARGRFTIRVALSATMRRKGSVALTVRHGTVRATKRLRF